MVRKNMTHLSIYILRTYNDLESIVEELSAIYDKKTLLQIYHEAVSEDYSFLDVNLMKKDKRKMFMQRFTKYFIASYIIFHTNIYSDDNVYTFRR